MKAVQKLLQEVEHKINFVHKEEDFYNLDQTAYPEVIVIKDSTDVYHRLFGFILNWQQTESRCGFLLTKAVLAWPCFFLTTLMCMVNRWMDGSFLDLDGESMGAKVDEFLREIFNMLKLFQQRQKKAGLEKENAVKDKKPTEVDLKPQESPTIHLCLTVINSIKEFKVCFEDIMYSLFSSVY